MDTWQAARWLARNELKREFSAYIFAFVVTVLFGLFVATLYTDGVNYFSIDIFYLMLLPSMGVAQSSVYFSFGYRKSDPFTRKLFFYRSLPISTDTIVLSRFLLLALSHMIITPVFLLLPYIGSEAFRELLEPGQFLLFMCIWFGYSLFCSSLHHFLEWSTSGRVLFWTGGLIAIFILGMSMIVRAFGISTVAFTIQLAQDGPMYPIGILAMGFAGALFWKSATQKRIKRRDLHLD